jgi:hypothetical protein
MGNEYRHRSPANIMKEIEYLIYVYNRPFISINDDTTENFREFPGSAIENVRVQKEGWNARVEPGNDPAFEHHRSMQKGSEPLMAGKWPVANLQSRATTGSRVSGLAS